MVIWSYWPGAVDRQSAAAGTDTTIWSKYWTIFTRIPLNRITRIRHKGRKKVGRKAAHVQFSTEQ